MGAQEPFRPAAIEDVVARIHELRPDVVFAPHVETSAGVILPDGMSRHWQALRMMWVRLWYWTVSRRDVSGSI